MDDRLYLDKILRLIKKGNLVSESEVCYFMILVRKQLEGLSPNKKKKFEALLLFCDWIAHSKITQSHMGLSILKRLNEEIKNFKKDKNLPLHILEVRLSKIISFDRLRNEIKEFLKISALPYGFVEDENWKSFLNFLTDILVGSPIKFVPNIRSADKIRYEAFQYSRLWFKSNKHPWFLKNAYITGLYLEKEERALVDPKKIEFREVVALTLQAMLNTGSRISILMETWDFEAASTP